jgi:nitrite reductase/ring-hydroxylating ferredoxin subunit
MPDDATIAPPREPVVHQLDTGYGTENRAIDFAFLIVEQARPPKARSGRKITVCAAADLPPGQKRIVEDGAISIGVFNVAGQFHAIKNVCPHQGAPLCQGSLHATHRPSEVQKFDPALKGRIVRCPWHGWEFDVVTGKGLYDRTSRVATYPVEVDPNGDVVVTV